MIQASGTKQPHRYPHNLRHLSLRLHRIHHPFESHSLHHALDMTLLVQGLNEWPACMRALMSMSGPITYQCKAELWHRFLSRQIATLHRVIQPSSGYSVEFPGTAKLRALKDNNCVKQPLQDSYDGIPVAKLSTDSWHRNDLLVFSFFKSSRKAKKDQDHTFCSVASQ